MNALSALHSLVTAPFGLLLIGLTVGALIVAFNEERKFRRGDDEEEQ